MAAQGGNLGSACTTASLEIKAGQPVQKGLNGDCEAMPRLWDQIMFEQLAVEPASSKILLTEAPLNSASNRRQTFEVMFEHYGFHAAASQVQAALTLYAQGVHPPSAVVRQYAARLLCLFNNSIVTNLAVHQKDQKNLMLLQRA